VNDRPIFKLNETVESLKTGKRGIIQATYPSGLFLMYYIEGYEHLYMHEMKHIPEEYVPFNVSLYRVIMPKTAPRWEG